MNSIDVEITRRFAKKLREELGEVEAIIYGSRARGESDPETDLDVCVVVEKLKREVRDKVFTIAWEISLEEGIVMTPLIFDKHEWENSPIIESPIYKNILREGTRV